ncbi:putative Mitochondrial transcription termination factor family protein [Hibiscus syriacus]|uniref:Mitochondrial transcription termination factor family protein n=1 Tax=Hibiscus syriacus TaxID=106335 RepID=A0A6A3A485_HIBSY|nr:cytochrome P450 71AU50-like [Hibiscus syriacus]KAE8698052.1 putative Mitochondrial transcription termination factor family protein [Hibiscus syriacus]
MEWTSTILAIAALIIFFFQALTWKRRYKNKRLPPGPRGLPILGNLLMIGTKPHQYFQRLALQYGPIMHLRLGLMPTIVVSSPEAAELFLKTNDLVFASRPPQEASKYISYNQQGLIFAPYGSYWRITRKMCTLELLSNHKISTFRSMRKQELDLLVQRIREAANSGVAVDLTSMVSSFSTDVACRMIIGKKYNRDDFSEKGFEATVRETMKISSTFNLADYIPQIRGLDLQGLTKRMKAIAKDFDDFFEKILEEHVQSEYENRTKDFVDVMLGFMGSEDTEYRVERDTIKAIILDMLAASMDTSAATIDWTVAELMRHPHVTKKLQQELEEVVGTNRMVEESDLEKLEYLDMVIKESLRLHPVALLIVHAAREDCTVNGFHIPKDARVFINAWAIGRDQRAWTDADKFHPERFVGSDIDVRGQNFELIPFGSGRRICPGMQLGLTIVRLVVAQLVHCFDWKLPNNMQVTELDMTEEFGIVCPRADHLLAIPAWRLNT